MLIIKALASILAPVSPIQFPLISILDRLELLPRLLMRMVVPVFSFESHTERDSRGWEERDGRCVRKPDYPLYLKNNIHIHFTAFSVTLLFPFDAIRIISSL